jgi:transglutaminase-like putative cysteine protease
MRKLAKKGQADPVVRRYAINCIREVQPKDHLSEIAALYYDTARRIRYTKDPAEAEYVQHPAVTLRERSGDCDDMATLLVGMLGTQALSVGAPTQFVTAGFNKNPGINKYTHVFMRVQDPNTGGWLVMDPVAGPEGQNMINKTARWKAHWT